MARRVDIETKTEELVLPIIEANNFELVDVEYVKEGANWYLRVYADKEGGIAIDDCVLISRSLEEKLDAEDFIEDAYILEVSSPGLGRPLKKEKDFARSIGEEVEIRTYRAINRQKEFVGILKEFDQNTVTISYEDDSTQIELTNGQDAAVIAPGYLVNKPWFVYDSETGLYKLFQNGEAQTDGNNGEQVAVKNVIIQICGWSRMSNDDEYLDMETMAGGNGYYITNGKAIPVTWKKEKMTSPTRYYDAAGNEIKINTGKTYVGFVPVDDWLDLVIE